MTDKKISNVCFTLNNPESELVFDEVWMGYLVYQKEKGEEGTEHYQGYLELKQAQRFSRLKAWLPRAHFEPRKGTQEQAIAYCKKEDTRLEGPWEFGLPKSQGKRSDLIALYSSAKQGKRKREVLEEMPASYMRHYKAYAHVQGLFCPPPIDPPRQVHLLLGEPGTGKTRYVKDRHPDHWQTPLQKEMWFDGYDGHDVVLIDDFAGQMPLHLLLQLLDRYVIQVPVKGGFTWWTPRHIYITSNLCISEWYDYSKRQIHLAALERRIHNTIIFPQEP